MEKIIIENQDNQLIGPTGVGKTKFIIDNLNVNWIDRKILFIGKQCSFGYDKYKEELLKFRARKDCVDFHEEDDELCSRLDIKDVLNDYDLIIIDESRSFKLATQQALKSGKTLISVYFEAKDIVTPNE